MTTFSLTLKQIESMLNTGYHGFDPAFDISIKNYNNAITDFNYIFKVETDNKDAISYFNEMGFEQV